jgi:polyisoprenoid-binding protein YceI
MTHRKSSLTALGCVLAMGLYAVLPTAATQRETSVSSLRLASSRVSIAGTSNIHPYTASTTAARIVRLQLASGAITVNQWEAMFTPGAIEAFEMSIPVTTLSSPKDGLDKNMHKALKAMEHPDITFRFVRFESAAAPDALRAVGILRIAGVERDVTLQVKTQRDDSTLTVSGETQLLMTDFGITPPKAMLGMLKTDPKVTVTFETVLGVPVS